MFSKKFNFESIYFWLAICTLAVFFVLPKFSTIGLILLLLVFIGGLIKKEFSFQRNLPLLLGSTLYLAYAIGCVFTFENGDRMHYLESKLSFFLIPLIFSVNFKHFIPNMKQALYLLWISILLATVICFVHAANLTSEETNGASPYFSSYYSFIHHPSYWVAMTQCMFLVTFAYNRVFQLKLPVYFWIGTFVLVLLNTYLAGSLAGILGLFICFTIIIVRLLTLKLGWLKSLAICLVSSVAFIVLMSKVNFVQNAVQPISMELGRYVADPQQYIKDEVDYKTGDQKRLIMWWVAVEIIQEHPFGVGTGNVDAYNTRKLNAYKQFDLAKEELNPHNQYLQIGIELGVLGIVLLVGILGSIVVFGIIKKDLVSIGVGSIMIVNALFESILQKSSGIFFFTFILSLGFSIYRNRTHFSRKTNS